MCAVRPATQTPNVTLWINDGAQADYRRERQKDRSGRDRAQRQDGNDLGAADRRLMRRGELGGVVAALGFEPASEGLANSSGLVGKRYMAHLATMMQGFHPLRKNDTVFQKTVAINDFYLKGPKTRYPLGQIQSRGRTHGVMAQTVVPSVPVWAYDAWVARGVDWLAMTEDLPRLDNKVTIDRDGRIHLHYSPNNVNAHKQLVRETKKILRKLGYWIVMTHSHKTKNTTHQCGTLVFGTDPKHSVLDTYCKTHDIDNLYVVDASFFPSSAAVNPGLTIVAQAIRVADQIRATRLMSANPPAVHRAGVEEGRRRHDAVLLEHLAILHHELHVFERIEILERIAGHRNEVGEKTRLDRPARVLRLAEL